MRTEHRPLLVLRDTMKQLIISFAVLGASLGVMQPSHGTLVPAIIDPVITSCGGRNCSDYVWYASSGTTLIDQAEATKPLRSLGLNIITTGLHCQNGSPLEGVPATYCDFRSAVNSHSPTVVSECRLKSYDSWELTASSTCQTRTAWGPHAGASPGAECVVFVQSGIRQTTSVVTTIYGTLDPTTLANSGSAFCQKPLPPTTRCELVLPPDIDHGSIAPNARSTASIDGTIDCGATPKVTFLGGGTLTLSPGIKTTLTSQLTGATQVRITSTLDAINGAPGNHSASTIVIVSPN